MDNKQVELTVRNYLNALRRNNISVHKAILYGSQVASTNDEDSDIDVAIISEGFGTDFIQDAVRLKLLALEVDPDISPRPYSLDAYRKAKPGDFLFDEVIIKGIVIS